MTAGSALRRISVADYERMAEVGILKPSDRVELLDGQLYHRSPIGNKHAACVEKIDDILSGLLGNKAMVRTQHPIVLSDYSEPEPDAVVVKYRADYYANAHPTAEDVYIVIEVANSTLLSDRREKLTLYAAAGIPEYWIVNLTDKVVEKHSNPSGEMYTSRTIYQDGQNMPVGAFNTTLFVTDLLLRP
jgi:Uma2 family endonuclease